MEGPSPVETVWTALSLVLLMISLWQWRVAVNDYKKKRNEARYKNGNTHAAAKLARMLSFTVALDCVVLTAWFVAGSLSVIRHYVELEALVPPITIVGLLYLALFSFGARVVLRAYSRLIVNKL
jgi:ABC-type uncharacterized transport system permease subunit